MLVSAGSHECRNGTGKNREPSIATELLPEITKIQKMGSQTQVGVEVFTYLTTVIEGDVSTATISQSTNGESGVTGVSLRALRAGIIKWPQRGRSTSASGVFTRIFQSVWSALRTRSWSQGDGVGVLRHIDRSAG